MTGTFEPLPPGRDRPDTGAMNVLIVDDHPVLREGIAALLLGRPGRTRSSIRRATSPAVSGWPANAPISTSSCSTWSMRHLGQDQACH